MQLFLWPPQSVSVNPAPIQYVLNGVDTNVSRDTVTPSNSRALPVISLDGSGAVVSPLTDAQLRATPVPVSGPLTDTQLRASAVPVSAASLPLPTGAATESTLSTLNGKFGTVGQKTMAGSAPVVIASDQSALPVSAASLPLPTGAATESTLSTLSSKIANNYGVATGAVRTAAQIGNASGIADFNYGTVGAQTVRTAAQIGNATGAADYNSGAAGAQTLRAVLATRHEAAATPLSARLSDGTNFIVAQALTAAQTTISTLTSALTSFAINLGWDGTTHRELSVNTAGALRTVSGTGAAQADGGSINNSTQGASAATVTAPANAIGFIITADIGNSDDLYWAVGATASATSGQGLQPGRDTGFVPCGANISIFGAATTPRYNIQWFTRS